MEAYIRQKRASPGMVQASDLQITRPMSASRNGRDSHAYDGPLQFMMSSNNPDQIITASTPTSPNNQGLCFFFYLLKLNPFWQFFIHFIDLMLQSLHSNLWKFNLFS